MFLKNEIFLLKINYFICSESIWCADLNVIFLNKKYIFLMYLNIKNTLKNNYNYNIK